MRAVLGLGIAVGGVALLAAIIYGVRLAAIAPTAPDGSINNPTGDQYRQHKGLTSTGGTQS